MSFRIRKQKFLKEPLIRVNSKLNFDLYFLFISVSQCGSFWVGICFCSLKRWLSPFVYSWCNANANPYIHNMLAALKKVSSFSLTKRLLKTRLVLYFDPLLFCYMSFRIRQQKFLKEPLIRVDSKLNFDLYFLFISVSQCGSSWVGICFCSLKRWLSLLSSLTRARSIRFYYYFALYFRLKTVNHYFKQYAVGSDGGKGRNLTLCFYLLLMLCYSMQFYRWLSSENKLKTKPERLIFFSIGTNTYSL
jgi:hypothetical protein